MHRPVGVVGLITPWNFPAAIPVWKLAPALIYGNTIVLKLAQDSPLTGLHIARALDDAGIPSGVLNVVIGRGSDVGTPLVEHPGVRAISFTGSVPVGEGIREQAGRLGKRAQLELGGHNPLIVMADADLPRAAEAAYAGAFWSAGQKCTGRRAGSTCRTPPMTAALPRGVPRARRGGQGRRPADPETEVGPLVNEKAMEDVLGAIERGRAEGGRRARRRRARRRRRLPRLPHRLRGRRRRRDRSPARRSSARSRRSTASADLDDAIARANAVEFGLSAAIFTSDLGATQRFVNELEAGILHVNSQTARAPTSTCPSAASRARASAPHEQGRAAREFYTEVVTRLPGRQGQDSTK